MSDIERFHWEETADRIHNLLVDHDLELSPGRDGFVATPRVGTSNGRSSLHLRVPYVQPVPPSVQTAIEYAEQLPPYLGVYLVVLIQAGAAAIGVWDDDELIRHKAIKKYMVRGSGKYQGTHLKTKGKSRYGSRLRLRNASLFLDEINERIGDWQEEMGSFDEVFVSCPVRLWADLKRSKTPFPLAESTEIRRIPLDVHVPGHKELLHVYYELSHGRIAEEQTGSAPGAVSSPRPEPPSPG